MGEQPSANDRLGEPTPIMRPASAESDALAPDERTADWMHLSGTDWPDATAVPGSAESPTAARNPEVRELAGTGGERATQRGGRTVTGHQVSLSSSEGPRLAGLGENWGQYEILRELGRGGMGVVYLARQKSLNRLVALKVLLSASHASAEDLARFHREAESVAQFQHPNIVQIYEVGWHEGLPYCALEYVAGGSLDRFLAGKPQPPRDGARLVACLADAVHAAHRLGIIHRDLKPANVLLATPTGELPAPFEPEALTRVIPKITDFGLAKRFDQTGSGATYSGEIVGTPSYMAPEQAAGHNRATIGPAADQYALGAILYELLVGRPPFLGVNPMDTIIQVLSREPMPPSRLQPDVPRDLETISLTCLRKEPGKRYPSVQALAEDLRRFLRGEPIWARPVGWLERSWKWCRRYPAAAALLLVCVCATLLTSGLAWWGLTAEAATRRERDQKEEQRRLAAASEQRALAAAEAAKRAQERAERERDEKELALRREEQQRKYAQAIADFVQKDFLGIATVEGQERFEPHREPTLGKDATLRQVLDHAARKLDERKDLDPLIEAKLRWMLGVQYRYLFEYEQALTHLRRCADLRTQALGKDAFETLVALNSLAVAYRAAGQVAEAIPLFEQVAAAHQRSLGATHPETLLTLHNLGGAYYYAGRFPEAIQLFEHVSAAMEQSLGRNHRDTLMTRHFLGTTYKAVGRVPEAIRIFEEVYAGQKQILGENHTETLTTLTNLAVAYRAAGRLEEAIKLFKQVHAAEEKILGADHPSVLTTLSNLAVAYYDSGRLTEAVQLFEHVHAALARKLGPNHPSTLMKLNGLASSYWRLGQLDKSIPLFEQLLAKRVAVSGRQHPSTQVAVANLGVNYKDAGRLVEAIPLLEEAYAFSQQHPPLRWVGDQLLSAYVKAGKAAEAESLVRELLLSVRKEVPEGSHQLAGELARLGRALAEVKSYAAAEPLLRECLAIRRKTHANAMFTFTTMYLLAGVLVGQASHSPDAAARTHLLAEAESLLLAAYEGIKPRVLDGEQDAKSLPAAKKFLQDICDRLTQIYSALDRADDVAKWQQEKAQWESKPDK